MQVSTYLHETPCKNETQNESHKRQDDDVHEDSIQLLDPLINDAERSSFIKLDPCGFFIRHPPSPHQLTSFITPDTQLFQTIHMGAAVVNENFWKISITGLVKNHFSLDLKTLKQFPSATITAFHECFGSPLKPPHEALWRIGNVRWTGVPLRKILELAEVDMTKAKYVLTEGLDRGSFAGIEADRYQKDLTISKAFSDDEEVMLVYAMNGEPLRKERGGPVRLVVPGWFGTNSTKWLCKIEVSDRRADRSPFTTKFYNVRDEVTGNLLPVWEVEVNSLIVRPKPNERVFGDRVEVQGWAWDRGGLSKVEVSVDQGGSWIDTLVQERVDFSWQKFSVSLVLEKGTHTLVARATGADGQMQPLTGHRNHCHSVVIEVEG